MSRDRKEANERCWVLNVPTKTPGVEYLISRVFGEAFRTHEDSVAP
jgi:hypothetical protein